MTESHARAADATDSTLVTAKITGGDAGAAAWLALADEGAGCIDPSAAAELRESVRASGASSSGAVDALCRIILGLECDARDVEAAAARRARDTWLVDAERELGTGFGDYARTLAVLLGGHGLHMDAVRVLQRATHVVEPEAWRTSCALGDALCAAGESDEAMAILRQLLVASAGAEHALFVQNTFARVASRLGFYQDAIALYHELAKHESTPKARRDAALSAALAARSSGDEPTARSELSALIAELTGDARLATAFGAHVVDELLALLLVAGDEAAIAVQERLVAAVSASLGPAHVATLQERANLSVVLRAVGRVAEADVLAAELRTLRPEGLSFDRWRPHLAPLVA